MWKHRGAVVQRGAAGKLGRRGLGYLLVLQVLLPLLRARRRRLRRLRPDLPRPGPDPRRCGCAFLLVQFLMALYAFRLDSESPRAAVDAPAAAVRLPAAHVPRRHPVGVHRPGRHPPALAPDGALRLAQGARAGSLSARSEPANIAGRAVAASRLHHVRRRARRVVGAGVADRLDSGDRSSSVKGHPRREMAIDVCPRTSCRRRLSEPLGRVHGDRLRRDSRGVTHPQRSCGSVSLRLRRRRPSCVGPGAKPPVVFDQDCDAAVPAADLTALLGSSMSLVASESGGDLGNVGGLACRWEGDGASVALEVIPQSALGGMMLPAGEQDSYFEDCDPEWVCSWNGETAALWMAVSFQGAQGMTRQAVDAWGARDRCGGGPAIRGVRGSAVGKGSHRLVARDRVRDRGREAGGGARRGIHRRVGRVSRPASTGIRAGSPRVVSLRLHAVEPGRGCSSGRAVRDRRHGVDTARAPRGRTRRHRRDRRVRVAGLRIRLGRLGRLQPDRWRQQRARLPAHHGPVVVGARS